MEEVIEDIAEGLATAFQSHANPAGSISSSDSSNGWIHSLLDPQQLPNVASPLPDWIPLVPKIIVDDRNELKSLLGDADSKDFVQDLIRHYPVYPCLTLAHAIWDEMAKKQDSTPKLNLLNNLVSKTASIAKVSKEIEALKPIWQPVVMDPSDSARSLAAKQSTQILYQLVGKLDLKSLLCLLGCCRTVGTVDELPPPISSCFRSFQLRHKPESKSPLTKGARALTKHSHRDQSNQFWGDPKGSEEKKNEHAISVLLKVLSDCVWINIHTLPHSVLVVEMRNSQGYGLRWLIDGSDFRGFLEPQASDGHDKGWRH